VVQQCRLADPRFTAHYKHPALAGPDAINEPAERTQLTPAALQRGGAVWSPETCGHRLGTTPCPRQLVGATDRQ
jgi:hypothetical protein